MTMSCDRRRYIFRNSRGLSGHVVGLPRRARRRRAESIVTSSPNLALAQLARRRHARARRNHGGPAAPALTTPPSAGRSCAGSTSACGHERRRPATAAQLRISRSVAQSAIVPARTLACTFRGDQLPPFSTSISSARRLRMEVPLPRSRPCIASWFRFWLHRGGPTAFAVHHVDGYTRRASTSGRRTPRTAIPSSLYPSAPASSSTRGLARRRTTGYEFATTVTTCSSDRRNAKALTTFSDAILANRPATRPLLARLAYRSQKSSQCTTPCRAISIRSATSSIVFQSATAFPRFHAVQPDFDAERKIIACFPSIEPT